jgi:GTP-binding protein HflX
VGRKSSRWTDDNSLPVDGGDDAARDAADETADERIDVLAGRSATRSTAKRDVLHDTSPRKERVALIGVSRPSERDRRSTREHLDELEDLAQTAGAEVVGKLLQSRPAVDVATFIGKGKVEFLRDFCSDRDVHSVIFDDDISPVQQRNLEQLVERKVLDRTALILDIFAKHARSNASKTQVELAQLEYLLPRLSGMWTHLSKQYGGIGTKGPGETQIESDRRLIRERIAHLKRKLRRIDRQRATQRKNRTGVVRVAFVGYTNAGKSTLLNLLTGASVAAEDQLFATLDPTVRVLTIGRSKVLLTDTVGFIRKLPAHLVATFRSTLEEIVEADILVHLADASHPGCGEQISVVEETLAELHVRDKPTILAFNKIDLLSDVSSIPEVGDGYRDVVLISAQRGIHVEEMLHVLHGLIEAHRSQRAFFISPPDFRISAEFHRLSDVVEERFEDDGIRIRCEIAADVADRMLARYAHVVSEFP